MTSSPVEMADELDQPRRRVLLALGPRIGREVLRKHAGAEAKAAHTSRCSSARVEPRGRRARDRAPLPCGQERVVDGPRREDALGRSEHHDDVEVGADDVDQPADGDAVAEPADSPAARLQLMVERREERLEVGLGTDALERPQLVEEAVDGDAGSVLVDPRVV